MARQMFFVDDGPDSLEEFDLFHDSNLHLIKEWKSNFRIFVTMQNVWKQKIKEGKPFEFANNRIYLNWDDVQRIEKFIGSDLAARLRTELFLGRKVFFINI